MLRGALTRFALLLLLPTLTLILTLTTPTSRRRLLLLLLLLSLLLLLRGLGRSSGLGGRRGWSRRCCCLINHIQILDLCSGKANKGNHLVVWRHLLARILDPVLCAIAFDCVRGD